LIEGKIFTQYDCVNCNNTSEGTLTDASTLSLHQKQNEDQDLQIMVNKYFATELPEDFICGECEVRGLCRVYKNLQIKPDYLYI
jgi:hypothetical protein